ncbi:DMT family transporter [Adhaeribacter radiodurans]|uniref:DMT family transporter n=1 Tax=Adhaeribacter radiodurans TaxID=2745197 RepID=A0A7L7LFJ6_9BACT|nr:DMT family transporter [Adhaeribacter radiodurans]QMU31285.1 DMT family transporter [Adhaeribacter radiodurans]
MPKEIYYVIAFIAGSGIAVQSGANAQLRLLVNNPLVTALISFLVGAVALVILVIATASKELPSGQVLTHIAWWKWLGGIMGAFYIVSVVITAPKIGAANTLGFVMAGQLLFAVLFDHFGWLGFQTHPVSPLRILGVALLLLGIYLIQKY